MLYHYLYRTTNLINGKIYIGIHSSQYKNDSYYGSGVLLVKAINKYGKENFRKDILGYFDSRIQASRAERRIVNKQFVERSDTYNLRTGGDNRYLFSNETKIKIGMASKGRIPNDETREKMRISAEGRSHSNKTKEHLSEVNSGSNHPQYGKPKSQETCLKISKAKKGRKNKIVTCPHCNKSGGAGAMHQWHFDNCKLK